jgi:hypothetical protein
MFVFVRSATSGVIRRILPWAAEQVRIWAPSPVKEAPYKAMHRKARAEIDVATVIVVDRPYRCRVSNEYGLDFRYGGCRTPYWPTRYPF